MEVNDINGNALAYVGQDVFGSGQIAVSNNAKKVVALLGTNLSSGGEIALYDSGGTGVMAAAATAEHSAEVCVDRLAKWLKCLGVDLPLTFH